MGVAIILSIISLCSVTDPEHSDLACRIEHELAFHLSADRIVFVVNPYADPEAAVVHLEFECSAYVCMVVKRVHQHMWVVSFVVIVKRILSPSSHCHPVGHVIAGHRIEPAHEFGGRIERGEIASAESASRQGEPVVCP